MTIRGDEARRDEVGKMSGHLERRDGGRERERERNETRNVIDLVRGNSEAMMTKRASRVDVSRATKLIRRERAVKGEVVQEFAFRISHFERFDENTPSNPFYRPALRDPVLNELLTVPSPNPAVFIAGREIERRKID